MIENMHAKQQIRLMQCRQIVDACISTFGLPMTLDALAMSVETPDGKRLLQSAAEFSRRENEIGPTFLPSRYRSVD